MITTFPHWKLRMDTDRRLRIPNAIDLGNNNEIVITVAGLIDCMLVYTAQEWSIAMAKAEKLPKNNKKAREILRNFVGYATPTRISSNRRFMVTEYIASKADLKKDCYLIVHYNKLSIWNPCIFTNFLKNSTPDERISLGYPFREDSA